MADSRARSLARSSAKSDWSASSPGEKSPAATPIRRNAPPVASLESNSRETAKSRVANCVGRWPERLRVRSLKSPARNFNVTDLAASPSPLRRRATRSQSPSSAAARRSGSATSSSNVTSADTLLVSRSIDTRRASTPLASLQSLRPSSPCAAIIARSPRAWTSPIVFRPAFSRRASATLPTPQMRPTGMGARRRDASSRPMTEKPRGFCMSDASFARNLQSLKPTETVTPTSISIRRARRASVGIAPPPLAPSQPARSRKASSIDKGSTKGVSARILSRMSCPTAAYLRMSGAKTAASGQSFNACAIGMAERTPQVRAM